MKDWYLKVPVSTISVGDIIENDIGHHGRVFAVTPGDNKVTFEVRGGRSVTVLASDVIDVYR